MQSNHYGDVIIGVLASQMTSLTIVYSNVYSGADQRKHQSPASLAFVLEIHRGPVNSPPAKRNCFHLMTSSCSILTHFQWRCNAISNAWFDQMVTWHVMEAVYTLRPRQNGRHFPDDIFQCIFFNQIFEFQIQLDWSLFLRDQLTITEHWLR